MAAQRQDWHLRAMVSKRRTTLANKPRSFRQIRDLLRVQGCHASESIFEANEFPDDLSIVKRNNSAIKLLIRLMPLACN